MGSIPTRTKLRNNLGQAVHAFVPVSPSSIICYQSKDGDVLWLGRWLQAWRKVMAAYCRGWLKKSSVGWLPVHRDQLQAQRSVKSMEELCLGGVVVRTLDLRPLRHWFESRSWHCLVISETDDRISRVNYIGSTQPCIPPVSLNRVPASAGVKAGKSPLPGGR